jgi:pimeloyl-ACP methyl ester carboxylesterase
MNNYRVWGKPPYTVAVVHGGPGAPGSIAPVARELSSFAGVLEPLQTATSIDGQVAELQTVLKKHGELPVTLIGWSWGAILSYITAARYPALVRKMILIGTPALETKNAADISQEWLNRLTEEERVEVFSLEKSIWDGPEGDKNASLGRLFRLIARAESFDPIPCKDEVLEYQFDINIAVGLEMRKLLAGGELLELGKNIKCPVVVIHGNYDTRSAGGVRKPLSRVLKDFKFILLEKCGHEPWREKFARDRFYDILKSEIQ